MNLVFNYHVSKNVKYLDKERTFNGIIFCKSFPVTFGKSLRNMSSTT